MANAFNRVGVFCHTTSGAVSKGQAIANALNNQFSDYWVPEGTTPLDANTLKKIKRPDGWAMRVQAWFQINKRTAQQVADAVDANIRSFVPGCILLDMELPDDAALTKFNLDVYNAIRALHPDYLLGFNVAPFKGMTLAGLPWATDLNLYASEQTYYGDMGRVAEDACMDDLTGHGIPEARAALCYGAAHPAKINSITWQRVYELPTIFYKGSPVSHLSRGIVFSDDLLADGVLI